MSRRIRTVMFWGNDQLYHRHILLLRRVLKDCISIASGLQQPPHSDSDKSARRDVVERAKLRRKLRHHVEDIAVAFGVETEPEELSSRFDQLEGDLACCHKMYERANRKRMIEKRRRIALLDFVKHVDKAITLARSMGCESEQRAIRDIHRQTQALLRDMK